jgi:hypothetical protein
MASAQGTERLGKLCALPFVGSQPPCWFGPTQGGFAGTQHFAAQRAEPNALAKIWVDAAIAEAPRDEISPVRGAKLRFLSGALWGVLSIKPPGLSLLAHVR